MTRRQTQTQKAVNQRLMRLKSFAEVLLLAIVLRFALNWVFKTCGVDLHVEVYEIALIWLFCV